MIHPTDAHLARQRFLDAANAERGIPAAFVLGADLYVDLRAQLGYKNLPSTEFIAAPTQDRPARLWGVPAWIDSCLSGSCTFTDFALVVAYATFRRSQRPFRTTAHQQCELRTWWFDSHKEDLRLPPAGSHLTIRSHGVSPSCARTAPIQSARVH